ncbi:hypothetical protein FA95DRAFT_1602221 [Auriscalpium vulgare]|uniref:Uncharacterized protein n=1 Tax=Auriscalpium vulgare TaxID=40419 RepID=A0ACB8S7R6_9AGAM|nr:hypothetical protein FA95DRAFT_1602221 [Auriscalpium vulgare]
MDAADTRAQAINLLAGHLYNSDAPNTLTLTLVEFHNPSRVKQKEPIVWRGTIDTSFIPERGDASTTTFLSVLVTPDDASKTRLSCGRVLLQLFPDVIDGPAVGAPANAYERQIRIFQSLRQTSLGPVSVPLLRAEATWEVYTMDRTSSRTMKLKGRAIIFEGEELFGEGKTVTTAQSYMGFDLEVLDKLQAAFSIDTIDLGIPIHLGMVRAHEIICSEVQVAGGGSKKTVSLHALYGGAFTGDGEKEVKSARDGRGIALSGLGDAIRNKRRE